MKTTRKITFEEVERRRRDFSAALRDFRKARGRYHNPAPELPAAKLEGCEVLANRFDLLDRLAPGATIAEIGAGRGDFSAEILARCRPARLHLFDSDASQLANPDIRAELAAEEPRVKMHVGDSAANLARLPEGYFDIVYIDGDHDYVAVQRDIAAILPRLAPGGAMVFHSYTTWSAVSMYHSGVARAVHEFCLANPWKFRFLALEPMMYYDVMLVPEAAS
jgi:predicted O-methyltransferase YrrM